MAIAPVGATPFVPPTISSSKTSAPSGFAAGLQQVQSLQSAADTAATGVATGSLQDIHQFTTASAKASLGVELTVALRNRAVDAYQEIMRMQV
jgi:flagellar hook-basal body complex protein FliE